MNFPDASKDACAIACHHYLGWVRPLRVWACDIIGLIPQDDFLRLLLPLQLEKEKKKKFL